MALWSRFFRTQYKNHELNTALFHYRYSQVQSRGSVVVKLRVRRLSDVLETLTREWEILGRLNGSVNSKQVLLQLWVI